MDTTDNNKPRQILTDGRGGWRFNPEWLRRHPERTITAVENDTTTVG